MKKNQKRLGNKGFSLVELIVVIAIMAVLVAVLAPTLIGNIEKSREAKDFNALDSVYSAVQTAYGDEAGNTAATSATATYAALTTATGVSLTDILKSDGDAFQRQVSEYLSGSVPTLTSKAAKGTANIIKVSIVNGKIRVWVSATADGTDAVNASKTTDSAGTPKKFDVQ